MKGRYTLLAASHSLLILLAAFFLLTALFQPLFIVRNYSFLISKTVMGFEDSLGLLYFIAILALTALTVSTKITRLHWNTALSYTPVLAYTILLLLFLLIWPLLASYSYANWFPIRLVDPPPPYVILAEGYYTYCLSCILLIAAQALGLSVAARSVSLLGIKKAAYGPEARTGGS